MKNKLRIVSVVVDVAMFLVLALVVITPYLLTSRFGTLERSDLFLGWNAGTWHQNLGWLLTGMMVLHVILNFKWVMATAKNFKKISKASKSQFVIMLLLFVTMTASIVSGAMWGAAGRDATDCIRMVHTLTSWAAVWVVGIHIGVHFARFLSFFEAHAAKK
ncbi:MAG: hypothetical protein FWD03_09635 [Defluviitaleaceae bacterium]|nr:hypothetical protein [Defluviitaleaceae bacterium]